MGIVSSTVFVAGISRMFPRRKFRVNALREANAFGYCPSAEQVRLALRSLEPGYALFADLTELETMDLSCSPFIANIMEMCDATGVAEVTRIIPDPTRDIGLQILSFFHYHNDIPMRTCASAAEANEPRLAATSEVD